MQTLKDEESSRAPKLDPAGTVVSWPSVVVDLKCGPSSWVSAFRRPARCRWFQRRM